MSEWLKHLILNLPVVTSLEVIHIFGVGLHQRVERFQRSEIVRNIRDSDLVKVDLIYLLVESFLDIGELHA